MGDTGAGHTGRDSADDGEGNLVSYDVKCDALAEAFLSDYRQQMRDNGLSAGAEQHELAQRIQDAIEDYLVEKGLCLI